MWYFLFTAIGMIGGGFCVYILTEKKRKALVDQDRYLEAKAAQVHEARQGIDATHRELENETRRLQAERVRMEADAEQSAILIRAKEREFVNRISAEEQEFTERITARQREFEQRVIAYDELSRENTHLKQDLRDIAVHLRKLQLDRESQRCDQTTIDERSTELAKRYLKESVKWISASLNPNNYAACKDRLQDAIARCRSIGFDIPDSEEAALLADLKHDYELVVRAAFQREEQARIRAQIREEQAREREIDRAKREADREKQAIEAALAEALAKTQDLHSAEIDRLQALLAEAEERSQRAISQAQLTKAGNIYVISNIGSFGDGVFKVGMTRRLEPDDRIRELGDASVPFPYDVHMMIATDDAPKLECALHRALHLNRINKVNPRKEFFRTEIEVIYQIVKEHHGEVKYVADAEALEYRQSLTMSEEDQEFIEHVFEDAGAMEEDEEETESVEA